MADYLDVVAFIEGNDGKKRPRTIGRVKMSGPEKGNLYLDVIPLGKWDGSAAIEVRQERGAAPPHGGQRGAPRGRDDFNDAF